MTKKLLTASIAFLFALTLSACGSAWIVRQDETGGIIGYQGFPTGEKAHAAIEKLLQCPTSYKPVSDQLMSSQTQYTAMTPVTTYSNTNGVVNSYSTGNLYGYQGHTRSTQYVPTTQTAVNQWREFTYRCDSLYNLDTRSPSNSVESDYNQCTNDCYAKQLAKDSYLKCLKGCDTKK